ncbi:hypothetical protein C4573_00485 [Candidatus Woesearchaeota archaeon]|nr:MAG: hypothetical protein C4573_00485 [Candidatus Woesearchaeota archaeon]
MPSIQTLIGERFEQVLQELYPDLQHTGDTNNRTPDFAHALFYAEAKVCFQQRDFGIHLKQYQIEAFASCNKPVIYIVGFHDFERSMERLTGLSLQAQKRKLEREMDIGRIVIVANQTMKQIWKRRNYVCEKGHIQDCTVRGTHLQQIIDNAEIRVNGAMHRARAYYGIPSRSYTFATPQFQESKGLEIGHILPKQWEAILHCVY